MTDLERVSRFEGLPPSIAQGLRRLREEQRRSEEQRRAGEEAALSLKPFPEWPEGRRGAPNMVIRSAIFGVVRRGRRRRVVDFQVASAKGVIVTLTGWLMDQHDLDLWLEVHHLARNGTPGEKVRFTMRSMLRRVRRGALGKSDYTWLEGRLTALYETLLSIETDSRKMGPGNLIRAFEIDRVSREAVVETNPNLRWLWERITFLEVEQRRDLGSNQLAKALHAIISTYPEWPATRLDTLMRQVGSRYRRLRDFKRDVEVVLADFTVRGWITGYSFEPGAEVDLVTIAKVPTPSQRRWLERLRTDSGRAEKGRDAGNRGNSSKRA